MLTIKVLIRNQKQRRLEGGTFICPECLEETYAFYAACPNCKANTFEARNTANCGMLGRLAYYMNGWPAMDKLSYERLKELKEK